MPRGIERSTPRRPTPLAWAEPETGTHPSESFDGRSTHSLAGAPRWNAAVRRGLRGRVDELAGAARAPDGGRRPGRRYRCRRDPDDRSEAVRATTAEWRAQAPHGQQLVQ